MKKIFLLIFLPLLVFNCKKEDPFLFEMSYRDEFEIQAGLIPNQAIHVFLLNDIPSNVDNMFDAHNTDISTITSINPSTARLSNIFSNTAYDFIRNISVRIYLDDPMDYREIFYLRDIPLNATSDLNLIPTFVDVKDYIKEDKFTVSVELELRYTSPSFIETRLEFNFQVK